MARSDFSEGERLMAQKAQSDAAVPDFKTLYKRYYQVVRSVVAKFRFHDATADDIIQDVFVQAWQNLETLKDPTAMGAWLMTIARNRCLNEHRKMKQTVSISQTDAPFDEDQGGHAEVVLVADDDFASLHFEQSLTLLRELIACHEGEPRATIAKHFYLDHKNIKEISDLLNLNQNTVLSHLRRFRLVVSQAMLRLAEEKGYEFK